tara:strand:- start:1002 stop:1937 length:936 start_codon:yes stop_codon:yes gene_type:complete
MTQTVLRYPLKVFTEQTDYLQIDVQEYVPVGRTGGRNIGGQPRVSLARNPRERFRRLSNKRPISTVLLPIPSNLQDGNSVSYNESAMNSVTAAAIGGATQIMKAGQAKSFDAAMEGMKSNIKATAVESGVASLGMGNATDLATKFIAAQAVNIFGANVTLEQIMARQTGEIFNPNMELLFSGPTLRAFKFQFKMMPRNKNESDQVKRIIRTFKKNMAPKTNKSNLFLNTPNIFELRYRQGATEHKFLHKFKQCVLQDIAINYTGEGNYATYDDGTPISMIMDLTFKELEPIYDIDYNDPDTNEPLDDTVGY